MIVVPNGFSNCLIALDACHSHLLHSHLTDPNYSGAFLVVPATMGKEMAPPANK